ncbi:amino acid ABC transporter permease [Thiohalocapsa marina]|uniref:Amino acid ABC transporter permease n=1 Tax=Thiohalocapsa marina TaxID=424902 RepID=A0A5M8FU73_9GAMM|nr:amino acid ABC transporter permease [Thiohalocapsa marina]KAA6187346.1 amino acid ABC transporter permease [Thiohalocapsa marina]
MSFAQIVALLATGAGYTVLVTLACIATGLLTGLGIALLGRLRLRGLGWLLRAYTYVFRGVPVLALLFLVFFGLPGIGFNVPPLLAMMLSLGLVTGAYLAEVFRGAFEAVDPNEIMAAEAMGMRRRQILLAIEMPQMLRFSVPGMLNEFTTVLKYSPFAYTVGLPDIMKQAMALSATTLRGLEIYLAVGLLYFAIYKSLQFLVRGIERYFYVPGFTRL